MSMPTKIGVFGKNKTKVRKFERLLKENGFKTGFNEAEMIISLGGDGTYLLAERKFPGIPKLLVRDDSICFNCVDKFNADDADEVVSKLRNNAYEIATETKLQAFAKGRIRICTNDLSIRNKDAWEAIRFGLKVNGKVIHKQLIGDGVVIATPFGSTGYFSSITRKSFKKGIGIAFNNATIGIDPLVVEDDSEITANILRGTAELITDNDSRTIMLRKNDRVKVILAKEKARLVRLH